MSEESGSAIQQLVEWVRYGPDYDARPVLWKRIVGFWLYWRTWAVLAVTVGGLIAALYIAEAAMNRWGTGEAILATYAVAYFVGTWTTQLSPKYNVTKNY